VKAPGQAEKVNEVRKEIDKLGFTNFNLQKFSALCTFYVIFVDSFKLKIKLMT